MKEELIRFAKMIEEDKLPRYVVDFAVSLAAEASGRERTDMTTERKRLIKKIEDIITGNGKSETGDWNSPLVYTKSDCDFVCLLLANFIEADRRRICDNILKKMVATEGYSIGPLFDAGINSACEGARKVVIEEFKLAGIE